jgi:hypothetical protein
MLVDLLYRGILSAVLGPQDIHHLLHHLHDAIDGDAPVTFQNLFRVGRVSVRWRKHAEVYIAIRTSSFEAAQTLSIVSLKLEGHSHWEHDVKPLLLQTRDGHHRT